MSKLQKPGLAPFAVILIFIGSSAMAQTTNIGVKENGALLMQLARELVSQSTCENLALAKENVVFYQKLRENHPGELPDRSQALEQINDFMDLYCRNSQRAFVATTTPIVTGGGGGVTCTRCSPVEGADGPALLPRLPSTPQCRSCGEVNVLTLALLHMNDDARRKFFEKLPTNVQEEIIDSLRNKKSAVTEIVQEISKPSPVSTPRTVLRDFSELQIPRVANPDFGVPVGSPRAPATTTVTPSQREKP